MTEEDNLRKIVQALAGELIQVVNKEHTMLLSEISRMKILINEASVGLHETFSAMSQENRELLQKVAGAKEGNDNPEKMDDKTGISKNMNMGIRALQFEDIVQQMLDHARHRIYTIERLFSSLEEKINLFDNDSVDIDNIRATLLECQSEIKKTRKILELENPVLHDSLGKNDVTLF